MAEPNKIELLPGKVVLRLIQPGSGAGAVNILGRNYVASYAGINATLDHAGAGFSEGKYTRMLNSEGDFSITLPNAAGTDGILHRLRFLCLTASNYRPTDEWIEIYRVSNDGIAGDLLFVGTPTKWTVSDTQITITGYDAFWTLKKSRETNAGWWCNSARDVFEEYTKAYTAVAATGFDDVLYNFPSQSSAVAANSTDGKWLYYGTRAAPSGGALRLGGSGAATFGELRCNTSLSAGAGNSDRHTRWRWEAGVTLGPGIRDANSYFTFAVLRDATTDFQINVLPAGTTQLLGPSGRPNRTIPSPTAGYHTFAIEGRVRWLYYYIDGQLVGSSYLNPATAYTMMPRMYVWNNSGDSTIWADVDYVLFRKATPYLSRNASIKGDYRLPGLPVPGGLMQAHWIDTDIKADTDYANMVLNPLRPAATQRGLQVKTLSGMDENNGSAPVAWVTSNSSSRFTGSIYLDFDNFDYRLQSLSFQRSRVWVGQTRLGEQVIDDWANAGSYTYSVASSAPLKGTRAAPGALYGQKSGWYPIIVEVMQYSGPGSDTVRECLSYMRSDHPNWSTAAAAPAYILGTSPINVPGYDQAILGEANLLTYVPLNQANSTSNGVGQMEAVNGTGTSWVVLGSGAGSYGTPAITGPVTDDPSFGPCNAGYARDGNNVLSPNGLAGVTFEAWIKPASTNTGVNQTIISKPWTSSASVGIYLAVGSANTIYWAVRNAAGTLVVTNTVAFTTVNAWTHVAGTYDNATGAWAIYINGVIPAGGSGTATAGACNWTAAFPAQVGSHYNAGTPNTFFGGYISRAAIYGRALPASSILAHYNAASTPTIMGGRSYQSPVPTSPQGIYEQRVRSDSYYEQLRGFFDNYALQATCVPMSLESGEFPGRLVPVVKQGRDTDFIVDESNCVAHTVSGDAEGVADTFVLDAQGIAEATGKAQLSMEGFNFPEIAAHLFPSTEYDSPGDINNAAQLNQRAQSLMALRANPWTSIDAQPAGQRKLTDTLPVTGALAEFAWEPGDGCRVQLPGIGVEDQTARQIMQASWAIYPDGIGTPSIGWRQRPVSFKEALRKIAKDSVEESRNYQGQIAVVNGVGGGWSGTTAGEHGAVDQYTRISLPVDLSRIVKLELVVFYKDTPAVTMTININGVSTGITFTGPGRFDITRLASVIAPVTSLGYIYAHASGQTAGCVVTYYLEAQTRI